MGVLKDYGDAQWSFFKWRMAKWFYNGVAIIIILVIYFSCNKEKTESAASVKFNQTSQSSTVVGSVITKTIYDEIHSGMSRSDVEALVGADGKILLDKNEEEVHTVVIQWKGDDNNSSAKIIFKDDFVTGKSQHGLK